MKAIAECIYTRGKQGTKYVRRRIPTALRAAYPQNQTHIVRSLGTSDLREAKSLARAELAKIDAEFDLKRQQLDLSRASRAVKRVRKLSDEQLQAIARFWMQQTLLTDELDRQRGLDDDEFDELGEKLTSQREELGRMLAQGNTLGIFPALRSFLYLCGLQFDPEQDQAKRASYIFLRAVVETLDHQLARQQGNLINTVTIVPNSQHPLYAVAPERAPVDPEAPTWDKFFETWRDFVKRRPKSTIVAYRTPWNALRRFAETKGVTLPGNITPVLMTAFSQSMGAQGLAVGTINERITKLRSIFKIALGRHLITSNPAADTLGFGEASSEKRRKRRLPFDSKDLNKLFGSPVYLQHKRSRGQSGEATYWIPLLMFYTGARPEELAGLALSDLIQDPELGWHLNLIDRYSDDDCDLFDDGVPNSHRRTLKNAPSTRHIPVAKQLIDLGLLRYVDWLSERGETVFFPTLKRDTQDKLAGAYSKHFGRYKRAVGIQDDRKVLYSFRHTMKDLLEAAECPSKYLKRVLGHTTGDGTVTDGYGSDLPFSVVAEHFARIKFPPIPALPWQPGQGSISLQEIGRSHACQAF